MKTLLKAIAAFFLAALARGVLRKYRPKIVMVTGSVGKTSTKDAVAAALSARFYLRKSEKSYNSEIGVPLTILGAKTAWGNPLAWLRILREGVALILLPNHYPKLLVLEVGADRPGDLTRILRIATPDAVVVTRLPEVPVHVEAYSSPEELREEEFKPAYALPDGAPLIIASDDPFAARMATRLPVTLYTYGTSESAQVRFTAPVLERDGPEPVGMQATAMVEGASHVLRARDAVGRQQLYAPAAALATALALSVSVQDALAGLEAYEPPPGRGRILLGKQGSTLIDDSYNSSPAAVREALASLSYFTYAPRRIAVLGDMLELGRYSRPEHEQVGRLAATEADMIIGVGERARAIVDAAQISGISEEQTRWFGTASEAAAALQEIVQPDDIVLIKGSQSIRLERVTEALLADPTDASKLVRHSKEWLRR